jgi:hypothetical protein
VEVVVRKKLIEIDGKQVEVEVFDTEIIPGKNENRAIAELLREDEIEKAVVEVLPKLDTLRKQYVGQQKDVMYYYEMGKLLQFVDKRGFQKEKAQIWTRIAGDLRPELFFGKDEPPKKISRYPEYMYRLAKYERRLVRKLPWSHWFEILQYPNIYENEKVLSEIVEEHMKRDLSRDELRERVKQLNSRLGRGGNAKSD